MVPDLGFPMCGLKFLTTKQNFKVSVFGQSWRHTKSSLYFAKMLMNKFSSH